MFPNNLAKGTVFFPILQMRRLRFWKHRQLNAHVVAVVVVSVTICGSTRLLILCLRIRTPPLCPEATRGPRSHPYNGLHTHTQACVLTQTHTLQMHTHTHFLPPMEEYIYNLQTQKGLLSSVLKEPLPANPKNSDPNRTMGKR